MISHHDMLDLGLEGEQNWSGTNEAAIARCAVPWRAMPWSTHRDACGVWLRNPITMHSPLTACLSPRMAAALP